jgi:hypothetical protein
MRYILNKAYTRVIPAHLNHAAPAYAEPEVYSGVKLFRYEIPVVP